MDSRGERYPAHDGGGSCCRGQANLGAGEARPRHSGRERPPRDRAARTLQPCCCSVGSPAGSCAAPSRRFWRSGGSCGKGAAAIVGQPPNTARRSVHPPEPRLDGGRHKVAHVLAGDAGGGRNEAHGLAAAALGRGMQRGAMHRTRPPFSQPISGPSGHQRALRLSTATRPSCRRSYPTSGTGLEQEAVRLHHVANPLHARGGPALPLDLSAQQGIDAPVAPGSFADIPLERSSRRQVGDGRLEGGERLGVRRRRSAAAARRGPLPGREARVREAERRGRRARRPPFGRRLTRKGTFWGRSCAQPPRADLVLERLLAQEPLQRTDRLLRGPALEGRHNLPVGTGRGRRALRHEPAPNRVNSRLPTMP